MISKFGVKPGQTSLTSDERFGLIPDDVSTHGALNEVEASNIVEAEQWAFGRNPPAVDVVTEDYVRDLHRRMFGRVWRWAGAYRLTNKNLGVPFQQIRVDLRYLLDDAAAWLAGQVYGPDESAIRFHHRLVWIHLFPNGNGRHGRLAADRLVVSLGRPRFSWGGRTERKADLHGAGSARTQYITALQAADQQDFGPLLDFARS